MTDFDVNRMIEFEIEQLSEAINMADSTEEVIEAYNALVDYYELLVGNLKQRIIDLEAKDDEPIT